MPVSPARAAAFDILLRVEQADAYASELLHSSHCAELSAIGFGHVDDIGSERLAVRFYPEAERSAPARGGHIMHAAAI